MPRLKRFVDFLRADVFWVALGQAVALLVGLASLKIFTNLFTSNEYAFIALMMASAAWIWTGLYQPLNQSVFRFYTLATQQGWSQSYYIYIRQYQKNIALVTLFIATLLVIFSVYLEWSSSFTLLVVLSTMMGMTYGLVHGLVSFLLAQRKRKPVTLIQSFDGILRLTGGLIAFYGYSRTEYATATGLMIAGIVFLLILAWLYRPLLKAIIASGPDSKETNIHRNSFNAYLSKMYVLMLLNASVIHLDKWLLFILLGAEGLGIYAALYLLAMTITTVMYVFFEMLGFPLIINQKSKHTQQQYQLLLLSSYAVCLLLLIYILHISGQELLMLLTTAHIAIEKDTFILLVIGCGLVNFGRIAMVQGQVEQAPNKYWPAYIILLVFFVTWSMLNVGVGDGVIAAKGFALGSVLFVITTLILNTKKHEVN